MKPRILLAFFFTLFLTPFTKSEYVINDQYFQSGGVFYFNWDEIKKNTPHIDDKPKEVDVAILEPTDVETVISPTINSTLVQEDTTVKTTPLDLSTQNVDLETHEISTPFTPPTIIEDSTPTKSITPTQNLTQEPLQQEITTTLVEDESPKKTLENKTPSSTLLTSDPSQPNRRRIEESSSSLTSPTSNSTELVDPSQLVAPTLHEVPIGSPHVSETGLSPTTSSSNSSMTKTPSPASFDIHQGTTRSPNLSIDDESPPIHKDTDSEPMYPESSEIQNIRAKIDPETMIMETQETGNIGTLQQDSSPKTSPIVTEVVTERPNSSSASVHTQSHKSSPAVSQDPLSIEHEAPVVFNDEDIDDDLLATFAHKPVTNANLFDLDSAFITEYKTIKSEDESDLVVVELIPKQDMCLMFDVVRVDQTALGKTQMRLHHFVSFLTEGSPYHLQIGKKKDKEEELYIDKAGLEEVVGIINDKVELPVVGSEQNATQKFSDVVTLSESFRLMGHPIFSISSRSTAFFVLHIFEAMNFHKEFDINQEMDKIFTNVQNYDPDGAPLDEFTANVHKAYTNLADKLYQQFEVLQQALKVFETNRDQEFNETFYEKKYPSEQSLESQSEVVLESQSELSESTTVIQEQQSQAFIKTIAFSKFGSMMEAIDGVIALLKKEIEPTDFVDKMKGENKTILNFSFSDENLMLEILKRTVREAKQLKNLSLTDFVVSALKEPDLNFEDSVEQSGGKVYEDFEKVIPELLETIKNELEIEDDSQHVFTKKVISELITGKELPEVLKKIPFETFKIHVDENKTLEVEYVTLANFLNFVTTDIIQPMEALAVSFCQEMSTLAFEVLVASFHNNWLGSLHSMISESGLLTEFLMGDKRVTQDKDIDVDDEITTIATPELIVVDGTKFNIPVLHNDPSSKIAPALIEIYIYINNILIKYDQFPIEAYDFLIVDENEHQNDRILNNTPTPLYETPVNRLKLDSFSRQAKRSARHDAMANLAEAQKAIKKTRNLSQLSKKYEHKRYNNMFSVLRPIQRRKSNKKIMI